MNLAQEFIHSMKLTKEFELWKDRRKRNMQHSRAHKIASTLRGKPFTGRAGNPHGGGYREHSSATGSK